MNQIEHDMRIPTSEVQLSNFDWKKKVESEGQEAGKAPDL